MTAEHRAKWQDGRALLKRVKNIHATPLFYDILARILPGLLLVLLPFAVRHGLLLTWDVLSLATSWLVIFIGLLLGWMGLRLSPRRRWIG